MTYQEKLAEILKRNLTHYDVGEYGDDHYDMIAITIGSITALNAETIGLYEPANKTLEDGSPSFTNIEPIVRNELRADLRKSFGVEK